MKRNKIYVGILSGYKTYVYEHNGRYYMTQGVGYTWRISKESFNLWTLEEVE